MTKVTVIMPSLNVVKYIEECLSSVVNQTLEDIEIIAVDAGSEDGTLEFIERYAAKDKRIRLVHSPKKSYGYQVNLAASMACGEYIGIVETDDYIDKDMYKILYDNICSTDADFVKAGWRGFFARNDMEWSYEDMPCSLLPGQERIVLWPRDNPSLFASDRYIWSGIYRKSFFGKFKLQETNGAAFQDVGMLFQMLHEAQKGIYIRKPLYNYRHDNEGASFHNPRSIGYIANEYKALKVKFPDLSKDWEYAYFRQLAGHTYGRFFAMATQGVTMSDDAATNWIRKELEYALSSAILHESDFDQFSWNSLEKFMDSADTLSDFLLDFFKTIKETVNKMSSQGVVIFGCKTQGRQLRKILGIVGEKVHCFCDNDSNLHHGNIDGTEILLPHEAVELYPKAVYVLTSKYHAEAMQKQLRSLGVNVENIMREWKTYISPKHTLWVMMHYIDRKEMKL